MAANSSFSISSFINAIAISSPTGKVSTGIGLLWFGKEIIKEVTQWEWKKKKHKKIDFSPTYYMLNSSEKNSKELIDANISYEEFELVANETWNIINWKKLLKWWKVSGVI